MTNLKHDNEDRTFNDDDLEFQILAYAEVHIHTSCVKVEWCIRLESLSDVSSRGDKKARSI